MANEKRIIVEQDDLKEGFPLFRTIVSRQEGKTIVGIHSEVREGRGEKWEFFESRGYLTREVFEAVKKLFEGD